MSDLKNQLNLCKIDRILFAPFLSGDNFDSGSSADVQARELLQQNHESLEQLLQSNIFVFCSQIVLNDDLNEFLMSYLNHRAKPYVAMTSNYADLVSKLDRQVYLVFLRLTSPSQEHRLLPTLYPKPPITVYHNNVINDGSPPAVDYSAIDQQYTDFVSSLSLLKMHNVIDLVSILSESNRSASQYFLDCLHNSKSVAFSKEVCVSVTEIHKATVQLAEATVALHQKLFDKPSINSASKAKKTTGPGVSSTAATVKPQDQPGNKLHFLASFVVDIVYSYSCWLDAAANVLGNTDLVSGSRLTLRYGVTLWTTLKLVYEVVLPLLVKVQKQSVKKSSQNSVVLTALQATEITNFLAIVQRKTLHCVQTLIAVCVNQKVSAPGDADIAAWEEVLQSLLSLKSILESYYKDLSSGGKTVTSSGWLLHVVDHVSVDDTELMLGALVSDFLKHNDFNGSTGADNVALVTELLTVSASDSGSSERIPALLTSLNTEDSVYALIRNRQKIQAVGGAAATASTAKSSTPSASGPSDEAFETIKAIFPDLGEGFIEACLQVYQNKSEQVIDALLSNNLNPKLALIDRKMKKMWKGKQNQEIAMYSAGGVSSNQITRDEKKADLAFKETQKARFRAAEKQAEYDSYIVQSNTQQISASISDAVSSTGGGGKMSGSGSSSGPLVCKIERDDYNDDYDDQYDDYIPSSKPLSVFKQLASQVSNSAGTSSANTTKSKNEFYTTEDEMEIDDPDHLEAEDFEAPDEDSDRDTKRPANRQQQQQQSRKNGPANAGGKGKEMVSSTSADQPSSSGISASKAKRMEKKANKSSGSSNSGKQYTEEDRAAMIQQMNETKRFNALLKDDEAEDAYWASMKNTNRTEGNRISSKDSWKNQLEDEDAVTEGVQKVSLGGNSRSSEISSKSSGSKPQPQQQQSQGQQKANAGGDAKKAQDSSNDAGGDGTKKKYHKKTYDKHHQQDKANRKFGSFQPVT